MRILGVATSVVWFAVASPGQVPPPTSGIIRGTVTLETTGGLVHHARVRVMNLGRTAETDENGAYEFKNVPPGTYQVMAHMHPLTDASQTATVKAGTVSELNFTLKISPLHEEVTVTASGREDSTLASFQTVSSLSHIDLAEKMGPSIGDVLEGETGVAKRSSGPGTGRPVIRGFDGDRVMVMQDGISTGSLSYQSGDHAEPIDVMSQERIEIVRGPATLLYGSNAIGGVVNAVSAHHEYHQQMHAGLRGTITASGGTNNNLLGGNGSFEYGYKKWMLWGGGSSQKTDDYHTPIGVIRNSGTMMNNANAGLGYYGDKYFSTFGYTFANGNYGVPTAPDSDEVVNLDYRRHNLRYSGGMKDLTSWIELSTFQLNYSDWRHDEVSNGEVANRFFNKQAVYRGVFNQKKIGALSGSFGFQGVHRDYRVEGEEAITPPVKQNTVAAFGLEQFDVERFKFQLGGRMETTDYSPTGAQARRFTGFSGGAGAQTRLWKGGSFVANYSHSFRAPALEELYALGPHAGNLTYEIGDPGLRRERGNGVDLSLRHQGTRARGELNYFYYWMSDYVFLAPTGRIRQGFTEARYSQGDARYRGLEARFDLGLYKNLWLNLGLDQVNADLRPSNTPLPRIPPLRGRVGFDARWKGLSVRPSVVIADAQNDVFPTETPTAGYTTLNLNASYILAGQHTIHTFGVDAFNLNDRLYRNHLSFIKEYAPEIGRGVRFFYSLQFF